MTGAAAGAAESKGGPLGSKITAVNGVGVSTRGEIEAAIWKAAPNALVEFTLDTAGGDVAAAAGGGGELKVILPKTTTGFGMVISPDCTVTALCRNSHLSQKGPKGPKVPLLSYSGPPRAHELEPLVFKQYGKVFRVTLWEPGPAGEHAREKHSQQMMAVALGVLGPVLFACGSHHYPAQRPQVCATLYFWANKTKNFRIAMTGLKQKRSNKNDEKMLSEAEKKAAVDAGEEEEVKRRGPARWDSVLSSRHKGVSWHKQAKKWSAQIEHGGRQEKLGLFATEEEAKAARGARCVALGVGVNHDAVEEAVASASRRRWPRRSVRKKK